MSAKQFHELVDEYYRTNDNAYLECIIKLAKAVRLERECARIRGETAQQIVDRRNYLAAKASRDEDSAET